MTEAASTKHATELTKNTARRRMRSLKDRVAHYAVSVGGVGVIVAIMLIFFYLLYVVLPLFASAELKSEQVLEQHADGQEILMLSLEEQAVLGMQLTEDGSASFFRTADGEPVLEEQLGNGARVSAVSSVSLAGHEWLAGFDNGTVQFFAADYTITYPRGTERKITPQLLKPLTDEPITISDDGEAIVAVAGRRGEDTASILSVLASGDILLTTISLESNFLTGEQSVGEIDSLRIPHALPDREAVTFALMDPQQEWMYLAGRSGVGMVLRQRAGELSLNERVRFTAKGTELTALNFLTGGISVMAGTEQGNVHQFFPVRESGIAYTLEKIRSFEGVDSPVTFIEPEERRKGFLVGHASGELGIYYSTSERKLIEQRIADASLRRAAISPRSDWLMLLDEQGRLANFEVINEHPEVSWSSIWGEVWYESYPEPDYVWQSSSASNDFEPKFSLVPLSFGTLKAAFYAMLIAMPLAIMGAIYTAYFMTPGLRKLVKPSVEVMEALPTVILGFLAGLWLAPLMEQNLPGIFLLLLLLPLGMIITGFAWTRVPEEIRFRVPAGWEAALLVLPIVLMTWLAFSVSGPIENVFFSGNMPQWLSTEMGISYDQRNAMVVGFAMGFAVIPTIFSIAEDAVFGVPKHLSYGSLALGATPWQTLVRVVLPTASPGIFSGVMIGLGRAVGETMIVLMATGNTPVLDANIFQGMRTLSANIAVEMPESEVGSSHYRLLFLAALVLFIFTFFFNTLAELIRQRLRNKYSAI
ncbi:MAG: ABC transporter permease subunit [Gammaproteobacteria bacterium]|nr:ABC transporter permease subunit [Gammaproteobacteria bacterium]